LESPSALSRLAVAMELAVRGFSHVKIFCWLSKILVFSEFFKYSMEVMAAVETGTPSLKIKTGVVPPLVPEVA